MKEELDENLASPGWVDLGGLLPFGVTDEDLDELYNQVKDETGKDSWKVDTVIISSPLMLRIREFFRRLMVLKADEVSSNKRIIFSN